MSFHSKSCFLLDLYAMTSGAGSRASAEQFVGSYDLVELTLFLVGDTIRKSAIRP